MALHLCYAALRLEAGGTHSECPGTQIPRLPAALGGRRKRCTALAGCCRGLWLYCGSFGDSHDVQALDRREPPPYRPGVNSLFLTAVPEPFNPCHVSCVVDRVEEISILCR